MSLGSRSSSLCAFFAMVDVVQVTSSLASEKVALTNFFFIALCIPSSETSDVGELLHAVAPAAHMWGMEGKLGRI